MKSIKFTPEMTQAIIDGRKTHTRRVIKSHVPLGSWGETMKFCPYQYGERLFVQDGLVIKVNAVWSERLQDISDDDCLAEGVNQGFVPLSYAFFELWESIYGNDPVKGWDANPWVWVIEFEKVEAKS